MFYIEAKCPQEKKEDICLKEVKLNPIGMVIQQVEGIENFSNKLQYASVVIC